ncbi:ribulokinase [Tunicatimonas pelagia]|uniref:ribulokinase n=1 Tax=Tunicatimonas pelagia TaxID=931531 RepID=UPI002666C1CC|nr:ribulokinase [Tunicatimonas pelagia]WKN44871.1 ribulokinase [Tunicatimonas pelagia]
MPSELTTTSSSPCVIGIDYGTDSVRSVVIDTADGTILSTAVFAYPRWQQGQFSDVTRNQFRQHPLDYVEGLTHCIREALAQAPAGSAARVTGIAVDTTGSTPCALDQSGTPLALNDDFTQNPNAMFVLWKDHTAVKEAQEINELAHCWETDYTRYEGSIYSSEWFWAKILYVLRTDEAVRAAAYSWAEHCDWIPFLLTGGTDVHQMKRSRCAAGHKAMWHPRWDGLPSEDFLTSLDPLLSGLRSRLYEQTHTSDQPTGTLSGEWAERLGLSPEVVVSVGAFDAHMGAVGGQIESYYLSKVMGTSTCDILVAPREDLHDKPVSGICGQVDGSVIPGMEGLEAGQSAFGDVYAWFKEVLIWPLRQVVMKSTLMDESTKQRLQQEVLDQMIPALSEAAEKIPMDESSALAIDWLNGRRTPDANQRLKGALFNLSLGTDAPTVFRALVEATCFGARRIVERFQDEGVPVKGLIGLGGVAKKSPFIMQTMANVMNMPIKIARAEQTCALGASMFAATAAGEFATVREAMDRMGAGFDAEYRPNPEVVSQYQRRYEQYQRFGKFIESELNR